MKSEIPLPVPILHQINTSQGGVPKYPVEKARVSYDGVEGDRQQNRVYHGGRDRALCLFSWDLIQALRQEGHKLEAGSTGENLTIVHVNWERLGPGNRLRIGRDVHIEIISYADPCRRNAQWFVNADYKRISHKVHPGWSRLYARVVSEGVIRRGDLINISMETAARVS
ncbi:MAG: MOSC domain-containing protein [Nitrospirales bacterium]|nr:MOSC domain-containing protein [Nitrospirales bacterium]